MFNSMPQVAKKAMTLAANGRKFITGEPNKLYYGILPLKQYLEENGERDAFIIRDLLKEQNWRAFESAYSHRQSALCTDGDDGVDRAGHHQRRAFAARDKEIRWF